MRPHPPVNTDVHKRRSLSLSHDNNLKNARLVTWDAVSRKSASPPKDCEIKCVCFVCVDVCVCLIRCVFLCTVCINVSNINSVSLCLFVVCRHPSMTVCRCVCVIVCFCVCDYRGIHSSRNFTSLSVMFQ